MSAWGNWAESSTVRWPRRDFDPYLLHHWVLKRSELHCTRCGKRQKQEYDKHGVPVDFDIDGCDWWRNAKHE